MCLPRNNMEKKRFVFLLFQPIMVMLYFRFGNRNRKLAFLLNLPLDGGDEGNAAFRISASAVQKLKARTCSLSGSIEKTFKAGPNELMVRILKPETEGGLSVVAAEKGSVTLQGITVKAEL